MRVTRIFLLLLLVTSGAMTEHISIPIKMVDANFYPVTVTVTGVGKPPYHIRSAAQKRLLAQRAATVRAYRNLQQSVSRIDYNPTNDKIVIETKGFISGAKIIQKRFLSDGSVEVDMSMTFQAPKEWVQQNQNFFHFKSDNTVEVISEKEWKELFRE